MPIPEAKADQYPIRRILLTTGWGVLFGFQNWRLAKYGFAASIPWYGSMWIFLSPVFLGFSLGATTAFARWWKRGLVLGLAFSLPSAFGARALGFSWVPCGIALITGNVVVGFLIALIADALGARIRTSTNPRSPVPARLSDGGNATSERCFGCTISRRLAEEKARLEKLDAEREYRGDAGFGKTTEERIVWGELLELELQDIDEQVSRICRHAGETPGGQPPRCRTDPHVP